MSSFLRRQEELLNSEAGHRTSALQRRSRPPLRPFATATCDPCLCRDDEQKPPHIVIPAKAGIALHRRSRPSLRNPYGSAWPPSLVKMTNCRTAAGANRVIIKPKVRGFICITAHPVGCEHNVLDQIKVTQAAGHAAGKGPKRVLVIGASTGYGLASRITAAFGYGAATLGVFFEKPSSPEKTGTAGWYNSAAFDHETRARAIEIIKNEMGGPIDLVVYSLASPVRKLPDTGEVVRSALKTI